MKYGLKVLLCCAPLLLVLACEETGIREDDAGTTTGRDAGPAPMGLTYTPEGCGYEVVVPEVTEAATLGAELGASPTPRFVHGSWSGPTESTFAVNWRTDNETTLSQMLYGTDRAAVQAAEGATGDVSLQEGHHVLFTPISGNQVRLHEVHVCGLSPSTAYYYKVGGPGGFSEVFDLATGPAPGSTDPFRFAVSGDSRNDAVVWAETQKAIAERMPDFQIFSGDAVVLGIAQEQWDGFFGAEFEGTNVQDVLATMAFMPVSGNHDALAINYVLQFALPQEQSPSERGTGEEWYSFDYGNAHFVMLNDFAGEALVTGPERDWLAADLAAVDREQTPWVFAMHHHPPYSCSTNHGSKLDIRDSWQPLYDQYEVDIVFNGHDHDYERSKPIRGFQEGTNNGQLAESGPNAVPVDQSGTLYVVAAGAGAPLYGVDDSCYHTHVTESVRNYVMVDIDGLTLRYTAYRLDGTVIDEFVYTKSP